MQLLPKFYGDDRSLYFIEKRTNSVYILRDNRFSILFKLNSFESVINWDLLDKNLYIYTEDGLKIF